MNKFLRILAGIAALSEPSRVRRVRRGLADRLEEVTERLEDAAELIRGRDRGDDRVVGSALLFMLGLGAGIGVGMLFAPAKGEETRSRIAEKARDMGGRVRDRFSSARKPPSGTYGQRSDRTETSGSVG